MNDQIIHGLSGHYAWYRRRVWFWQRKELEADGWVKSAREGAIRPMMVKRVTREQLQREKNIIMRSALDGLGLS